MPEKYFRAAFSKKILQYIGFGSGSGTNLQQIYLQKKGYRLRAVVVDRDCPLVDFAKKHLIPCILLRPKDFPDTYETALIGALQKLEREEGFSIDYIFLGGFMRVLKKPILDCFSNRIINIHPADLEIVGEDNKRLLVGRYGILKTFLAGIKETKSTVHFINEEVDMGKIIRKSSSLHFDEIPSISLPKISPLTSNSLDSYIERLKQEDAAAYQKLLAFSKKHQEKQKKLCDWPTYTSVAEDLAKGDLL